MEQRVFHGNIDPEDLAEALEAEFNRGEFVAQRMGRGDNFMVQVATRRNQRAGGQTALSISVQKVEDGVAIGVGQQEWVGVAASLGKTAFSALRNPLSLLGRLDDIAQDVQSLQLEADVWRTVEALARTVGASHQISERLRRLVCAHCDTANEVGAESCVACGAPLGRAQPVACLNCGFVVPPDQGLCPNCGKPVAGGG